MDKGLRRFGSTEDYCHFLRGVLWQRIKRAADGLLPGGGAGRRRGLHNALCDTGYTTTRFEIPILIVNGTAKPKEIVQTFRVPMGTVKRYMKVYRDYGAKGFYEAKPRHSSASVLKGEVLERAQQLLDEGQNVPEVAKQLNVFANTIHKAIRAGRLRQPQKKANSPRLK